MGRTLRASVAAVMMLAACGGGSGDDDDEAMAPDAAAGAVDAAPGTPVLADVSLSPEDATVASTLRCTPGEVTDPDSDGPFSFAFRWLVDDELVADATTDTLAGATRVRGESVVCEVTPNDGVLDGAAVRSNAVVVGNSPPSVAGLAITPAAPTEATSLQCVPDPSIDLDGDAVTLAFGWQVGGVAVDNPSDTLSPSFFAHGDEVGCAVVPSDPLAAGAPVSSATVIIGNTAPVASNAMLTPAAPTEASTLACSADTADLDGDAVTLGYAWTVNGLAIGASGASLTGADFDRDDVVACLITPSDGTTDGEAVAAGPVTIGNTAPTAPGITLSPATPLAGLHPLTCAVSAPSSDLDADELTYTFAWTRDGIGYAGATSGASSSEVPGNATAGGEVWSCAVTASDGSASSVAATASVTIVGVSYIGYRDTFANPQEGLAGANYLLGQAVVVPSAVTLAGIGTRMRLASPDAGRLALYTNSGGAPGTLVTWVELGPLDAGPLDRLLPGGSIALSAGTYWLMWNFSANVSIEYMPGVADTVRYRSFAYGAPPPASAGATTAYTGQRLNLYLITE